MCERGGGRTICALSEWSSGDKSDGVVFSETHRENCWCSRHGLLYFRVFSGFPFPGDFSDFPYFWFDAGVFFRGKNPFPEET